MNDQQFLASLFIAGVIFGAISGALQTIVRAYRGRRG